MIRWGRIGMSYPTLVKKNNTTEIRIDETFTPFTHRQHTTMSTVLTQNGRNKESQMVLIFMLVESTQFPEYRNKQPRWSLDIENTHLCHPIKIFFQWFSRWEKIEKNDWMHFIFQRPEKTVVLKWVDFFALTSFLLSFASSMRKMLIGLLSKIRISWYYTHTTLWHNRLFHLHFFC